MLGRQCLELRRVPHDHDAAAAPAAARLADHRQPRAKSAGVDRGKDREPGSGQLGVERPLVAQHLEERGVADGDVGARGGERGTQRRERLELVVGRRQHQPHVLRAAQRADRFGERVTLRDGRDAPRDVREGRRERRAEAVGDDDPEAAALGEQAQDRQALEAASRYHEHGREARRQGPASR